jgi:hypothetical protein
MQQIRWIVGMLMQEGFGSALRLRRLIAGTGLWLSARIIIRDLQLAQTEIVGITERHKRLISQGNLQKVGAAGADSHSVQQLEGELLTRLESPFKEQPLVGIAQLQPRLTTGPDLQLMPCLRLVH